ncbi:MAG TPA: histone deacetylase [candidate division Zixibacteria bacterium]|nr:histone deacetylase [candidate division Zixibacteria bacterium]
MSRTAIVVDADYLKHDPGFGHPERPERIEVLLDLGEQLDRNRFERLPPRAASRDEIELCHGPDYVDLVASTSRANRFALDGDTITCRDSFGVGLLAVGGFLRLLDAVAAGECRNGFALVRPPGHHALRDRAMGFCLFNTVAIGARYLQRRHGAGRVLIVDWDVHHGNGTQDAFYADPSVLYVSTHQYPFYPGTGGVEETGEGEGEGYTINIPLPAGCGDAEYIQAFREVVVPAANRFQPDWVLVSAGFDPHRRDPLGGMAVTEDGFAAMTQMLVGVASEFAGGRMACLLEGGYDLSALRNSTAAVLECMQRGAAGVEDSSGGTPGRISTVLRRIRQVREKYQ